MNIHDAWASLRHGGNLLSPNELGRLPEPGAAPYRLAERLRAALVALDPDKPGEALGALLDVVLEDGCGLIVGWRKGSAVKDPDAETLLDGTRQKPQRVWETESGDTLPLFTTQTPRIGVGKGRQAVAHVVEYLRRRRMPAPLALLTNGREWRLIWADVDNLAWVEWDADRWLDADQLTDTFHLLRRLVSRPALDRDGEERSKLLEAIRATRRGQAKLSSELGENVRRAVETLLRGRQSVLAPSWDPRASKDVYAAACHFVMRLVVILFAEARELFPVDNPVYHQTYGLRGLQDQLGRLSSERRRERHSAWSRLLALFRLLHRGSPHPALALPEYGGDLFRPGDPDGDAVQRALARIESPVHPPDDEAIHEILVRITRTKQQGMSTPVNFTELTSEYIGILYEGLLDYELHRGGAEPVLFLRLGDQPALPLDQLETMSDKALAALVEKARVTGTADDEDDADDSSTEDAGEPDDEPSTTDDTPVPESAHVPDDHDHVQARARALAWGRRAVVLAKLVKKPAGRNADKTPEYLAELDRAADQLVADIKLPGELYLVRWGGTRKGAGTFYTRPQLTQPTVRRTLEPLTHISGAVREPEVLLDLKICDPAMGSGSFLVAALRVLTELVAESLRVHGRIHVVNGRTMVDCNRLPEADRDLPTEGFDERLTAIVRRAVVERCLYGVDLDPLATELGRVALWVETLDRKLPFTFLDHKLRCGDALVGAWIDRFRDYPLLAWWRQSPDEKWRGVTHEGNQWADALKERRKDVVEAQREQISGQTNLLAPGASDDEIGAALARVRELYGRLRTVSASQPEKRARVWREQILPDPALARVREALDLWCALWFWPLDALAKAPTPATLGAPSDEARAIVRELRETRHFFHWELEFPDVFNNKGAGFDAIVGNPPWEIRKPNSKEFFSDRDPLYRAYGKQEALTRQRELFQADPTFERKWLDHVGFFKDLGNFVRHAAEPFGDIEDDEKPRVALVPRKTDESRKLHKKWADQRRRRTGYADPEHAFRHQGSADLNSYKLFVEQAHALLKPGGQLGLVTPSGLYTDKGAVDLRRLLLDRCQWRWLYGFDNRNKLFDIHRSFKFAVTIAQKGGQTTAIHAAFMRHELEDWADARDILSYSRETLRRTGLGIDAFFEVGFTRDTEVLARLFVSGAAVADLGFNGSVFTTELHKTNDSRKLHPRVHLSDWGLQIENRDFRRAEDRGYLLSEGWTPVWEGKCCRFDEWIAEPVLYARVSEVSEHLRGSFPFGFRRIARNTDVRTLIGCIVPPLAVTTYTIEIARDLDLLTSTMLYGLMSSFVLDWVMRFQVSSSVALFNLHALPLPASVGTSVADLVNRLLAQKTPVTRVSARVALDSIVAALYGLSRDDLRWVLRDCDHPKDRLSDMAFCRGLDPKGFWRVEKDQDPELRHTVLTLVAFDTLERLIAEHGGDRNAGIRAFNGLNDGEGWMLPGMLRLADHGLGRDARADTPQPVAGRLGPRLLDWQFAQTPEESWAECDRHARALLGDEEFDRRFPRSGELTRSSPTADPIPDRLAERASTPTRAQAPAPPSAAETPQLSLIVPTPTVSPAPALTPAPPEPLPMTISQIRLLNFRNWADEHWDQGIILKPITLVLGRNSAGKTSILQPLRMLKQSIEATDAGVHLLMDSGGDGINLGEYRDVVHGHDEARELGVGIDLEDPKLSVDVRFRLIDDRPTIEALSYRLGDEKIEVTRTHNAYQLSSPRFRLPNWDGDQRVHEPRQNYRPGRAIEFSEEALAHLGLTLGPRIRDAMVAVKDAFKKFHYLGPLRPPPVREVAWSQQDPTRLGSMGQETIQALISNETGRDRGTLKESVSAWLKRLDLADGIEVTRVGRSRLYAIEVLRGENRSNLVDVGYGVSQVLPVIVLLHFAPEGSVLLCEDPEAHLHPMAQAELAEMFVEVARQRKLQILLETHSEHLFRRLQFLIADDKLSSEDCALYYVDRDQPSSKLTTLQADEFGRVHNWPDNFFGDAIGEVEKQTHKVFERMRKARSRG